MCVCSQLRGRPAAAEYLSDTFLSTGAISQDQHDKSLNCLIEKMGVKDGR